MESFIHVVYWKSISSADKLHSAKKYTAAHKCLKAIFYLNDDEAKNLPEEADGLRIFSDFKSAIHAPCEAFRKIK